MEYYYSEQDLCDILETSIKEYETEFGIPDKVINSFLKEREQNKYVSLKCQCRIYLNSKKLIFITDELIHIIPFNKIIGYDAVDRSEGSKPILSARTTTTTTDTGNIIKRAIIGGVVAGGAGAVIGGATAKRSTKVNNVRDFDDILANTVFNFPIFVLNINVDDILYPLITLPFGDDKQGLEQVTSTLNVIIKRNADLINNEETNIINKKIDIVEIGIELDKIKYNPNHTLNNTHSVIAQSNKSASPLSSKAILFCIGLAFVVIVLHQYISRELFIGTIIAIIAVMYYFYNKRS